MRKSSVSGPDARELGNAQLHKSQEWEVKGKVSLHTKNIDIDLARWNYETYAKFPFRCHSKGWKQHTKVSLIY